MDPHSQFVAERKADIEGMAKDDSLRALSLEWMLRADRYKYTYNFSWLGRPIIKYPSDIIIQQELIWELKPDLVIETGIAHGGSLIFSASMLELIGNDRAEVVGIDVDIRAHNRQAIESHPMARRITMYEGNSLDEAIVSKVRSHAVGKSCVMVILDSLHSHEHVYGELKAYAPLVTVGSYCILPDTFIEFFPKGYYSDTRPWDVGDNPYTAMQAFVAENDAFRINKTLTAKAMITETIDGYLLRVK